MSGMSEVAESTHQINSNTGNNTNSFVAGSRLKKATVSDQSAPLRQDEMRTPRERDSASLTGLSKGGLMGGRLPAAYVKSPTE